MNTYRLKETRDENAASREIELNITNQAVKDIAPEIRHLLNPGQQSPFPPTKPDLSQKQLPPVQAATDVGGDSVDGSIAGSPDSDASSAPPIVRDVEDARVSPFRPRELFEQDGEYLVPQEPDFKGTNKKAQNERFISTWLV